MVDGVTISGGPYDGMRVTGAPPKEAIGLGLDDNYQRKTTGTPFAVAVYRRKKGDSSVFCFDRIVRLDGKAFQGEFVDGPVPGVHDVGQPIEFGPDVTTVPLTPAGDMFEGVGDVDAVAIYRKEQVDDGWVYRYQRTDCGDELQKTRHQIAVRRAKMAVQGFYGDPNYEIYSIKPTGEHPQKPVQVGKRQANVDEGIARLIELLWRLEFDTIGSCQERSSSTSTGMAYVSLPIPGQGEALLELLQRAGIECKRKPKTFGIKNSETGEKIDIPCSHILFAPKLIPEIENVLQSAITSGFSAPT